MANTDRYYHFQLSLLKSAILWPSVSKHRGCPPFSLLTLSTSWLHSLALFLFLRNRFDCLLVTHISIPLHKALWTGRLHKQIAWTGNASVWRKAWTLSRRVRRIKLYQGNDTPEEYQNDQIALFWWGPYEALLRWIEYQYESRRTLLQTFNMVFDVLLAAYLLGGLPPSTGRTNVVRQTTRTTGFIHPCIAGLASKVPCYQDVWTGLYCAKMKTGAFVVEIDVSGWWKAYNSLFTRILRSQSPEKVIEPRVVS